jgi:hypothetical protein
MKKITTILLLIIAIQFNGTFVSAQTNLVFDSNERTDGTAFFSMDIHSGQVYYMLDYGSNSGNWKAYGGTISGASGASYSFVANERTDGTAFFAMNNATGQVYYMLDYGSASGSWKSYGGIVPNKTKTEYSFEANERTDGTAFFCQDHATGQVYFMLDYGSNSGSWKAFGGTAGK